MNLHEAELLHIAALASHARAQHATAQHHLQRLAAHLPPLETRSKEEPTMSESKRIRTGSPTPVSSPYWERAESAVDAILPEGVDERIRIAATAELTDHLERRAVDHLVTVALRAIDTTERIQAAEAPTTEPEAVEE